MTLKETIQADFVTGMKAKDTAIKSALSGLKAKITEAEKANGTELNDDGVIKVVAAAIKQRRQSVEEFMNGGRADLVEKERSEINVLERYMPVQMSEKEITQEVNIILLTLQANPNRQARMGQCIGAFNKKFIGKADIATVKRIIDEIVQ